MKSTIFIIFVCVVVFTCCFEMAEAKADNAQILENYGKIPLAFTMNQGQVDSQVKFTAQGSGCSMFFTPQGTTFLLSKETEASVAKRLAKRSVVYQGDTHADSEPEIEREYFALKLNFLNANSSPEVAGEDRLPWNNNYFLGNDPSTWRTDVPNYEKIRMRNVYDGIDLVYYGNRNKIKYDFVVRAGEDPSHILLKYDFGTGTQGSLSITTADELVVSTPLGDLIERKPYCYQVIDGKKVEVEGQYIILDTAEHTFSFAVDGYNPAYDLVIDPTLEYSTYLGTIDIDVGYGIAVDGSGCAYVTGYTESSDFPTVNPYQSNFGGGLIDAFVTKFSPAGNTLVYSTYLGGNESDLGHGIAVDGSGCAYVTGFTTSTDFPTVNPYQKDQGNYDVFVTKLNPSGNNLVYSTYLGTIDRDGGRGIAVDGSGCAYVTGETYSPNFPTVNPNDQYLGGESDAFVTKISPAGNTLIYSTYLGGNSYDWGYGIAVDGSGSAYVSGETWSTDFPTENPCQPDLGMKDAFVTKFSPAGNTLVYSTYLGGSHYDFGRDIAVDSSGCAYVTGYTHSTDFPTVNPYQPDYAGGDYDTFVTKLNPSGNTLVYSTYLGGGSDEYGTGIAVDSWGSAYVTGDTTSPNFPTENPCQPDQGGQDAFVTKLNPSGNTLVYSTYLGGDYTDDGSGIAVDGWGSAYVTGLTKSTTFPVVNPYQSGYGGGTSDVFVAKFFEVQINILVASPNGGETWAAGSTQDITWASTGVTTVKIEYSSDGGSTWNIIAEDIPGGSFDWNIPFVVSESCLVKITSEDNSDVYDVSDDVFTIRVEQYLALVALYNSTDGDNWTNNTNWLTEAPISEWYGVAVSGDRVTRLALVNNNLTGEIPPEIGNLTNLEILYLSSNQLTGSIPTEIGKLINLKGLSLGINDLTGEIPPEIGKLTNLTDLRLSNNQLSGEIPTEIGNFTNLQYLYLQVNQLSGTIPDAFAGLTDMEELRLENNQLSGTVPNTIICLINMTKLYLHGNELTDLPVLSSLTSLRYLQIENNKFTFEDIEPNLGVPSTTFTYAPQDRVGEYQDITKIIGESLTVSVTVGGEHNIYQWFKDGSMITDANDYTYTIDPVSDTDSGAYTCKITNDVATKLTLYSRPINVVIINNFVQVVSTEGTMGEQDVPVELNLKNEVNISAVAITLTYDSQYLSFTPAEVADPIGTGAVVPTTRSSGYEQNSATIDTDAGTVTIIGLQNLLTPGHPPITVGEGAIYEIRFDVLDISPLPQNDIITDITITKAEIADESGILVEPLDKLNGTFTIHPYMLGDCNDNGRIDIGDALYLINYLLELGLPPDPIGRGDCNQNGKIDIGDVVMIINNLLFGTPIEPLVIAQDYSSESLQKSTVDSHNTTAQVSLNRIEHPKMGVSLDVDTENEVAGVYVKIVFDSDQLNTGTPTLSQRTENMELGYNFTDNGMNVVIYSMEGKRIEPGNGSLLSIPVQPKEGINHIDAVGLTIDDISLSDIEGRLIPVEGLNISTSIDSYDREALLDMEFKLEQNYPNPFNPETVLAFSIPLSHDNEHVQLRIYNLQGQLIRTLINTTMFAGFHSVRWDGKDMSGKEVSGGLYLYQLKVNDYVDTNKMMLMR